MRDRAVPDESSPLDEAWAAADAGLPTGWTLTALYRDPVTRVCSAWAGTPNRWRADKFEGRSFEGPTLAAALAGLIASLAQPAPDTADDEELSDD